MKILIAFFMLSKLPGTPENPPPNPCSNPKKCQPYVWQRPVREWRGGERK